ncbi:MAG TPA: guanylate kinase [Gaiellaceae bacterium]|nr:guanylate kinase [Gaiellaceae bacterium]
MGSSTVRRGTARASPVFVVTGTSGAGKGTLERALLGRVPELELAVSATTRERRPGEQHGREYWFLSEHEFDRKVREGDFLEWIQLAWGPRSGTLLSEIDRIQAGGRIPLLDLETEGALRVRERVPGAVTVFVRAPSFEENERRLRRRATEGEAEIEERLRVARAQLEQADAFDHVVVNDELRRAVDELEGIVRRTLASAGTMSAP